jgi:hypothetical protein
MEVDIILCTWGITLPLRCGARVCALECLGVVEEVGAFERGKGNCGLEEFMEVGVRF